MKKEKDEINLRKPVLIVSMTESGPNVSISSNLNFEACDNKMVCSTGGRTGGFCTACSASEKEMHGDQVNEPYYMDLGVDKVWEHFNMLLEEMGDTGDRLEEVVIPSACGDYSRRLGTKHAPMTDQIEFSKVNMIDRRSLFLDSES